MQVFECKSPTLSTNGYYPLARQKRYFLDNRLNKKYPIFFGCLAVRCIHLSHYSNLLLIEGRELFYGLVPLWRSLRRQLANIMGGQKGAYRFHGRLNFSRYLHTVVTALIYLSMVVFISAFIFNSAMFFISAVFFNSVDVFISAIFFNSLVAFFPALSLLIKVASFM